MGSCARAVEKRRGWVGKPERLGISASGRLVFRDVAQPGSAPEWGSGGRGFKSRRPDSMVKGSEHLKRLEAEFERSVYGPMTYGEALARFAALWAEARLLNPEMG